MLFAEGWTYSLTDSHIFSQYSGISSHSFGHLYSESQTPESIMYGVDLETIPISNFHTLFCLIYVLDHLDFKQKEAPA
jgi:hypothetical protein